MAVEIENGKTRVAERGVSVRAKRRRKKREKREIMVINGKIHFLCCCR